MPFECLMKRRRFLPSLVSLWAGALLTSAQAAVTLSIQADQPVTQISPTMWGVFSLTVLRVTANATANLKPVNPQ